MKQAYCLFAILIAGMMFGTVDFSSDVEAQSTGPRLAFIEIDRVLEEATAFKAKRDEMIDAKTKAQDLLDTRRDDLLKQRQELEDKKELMKESQYYKQRTELEKQLLELRALKQEKERNLANLIAETLGPLRDDLQAAIEDIAKEEGVGFVFKKENLAYGAAQFDITQKVIDRLNRGN